MDLSFLNPAMASDYRGFAAVMVLLAVVALLLNCYRGFLAAEVSTVNSMSLAQQSAYVLATGRTPSLSALPLYVIITTVYAQVYVGMLLFGGTFSILWGVLFYLGTNLLSSGIGGFGGFTYGIWVTNKFKD
jgi:hypothetical protein